MSGRKGVLCRLWSGTKAYSLVGVAGSSGGGRAGSSFMILSYCWWKNGACFYVCSWSVSVRLVFDVVVCSVQCLLSLQTAVLSLTVITMAGHNDKGQAEEFEDPDTWELGNAFIWICLL